MKLLQRLYEWGLRMKKFLSFGIIGGSVALASFGSLYLMIGLWHWPAFWAYVLQTVIAVELNFVLNNVITFRHQHHDNSMFRLWVKFHAVRVISIPANQVAFSLLVWLGVPYLIANLVCIVASTLVNFLTSDRFVYARKKRRVEKAAHPALFQILHPLPSKLPMVSVVIPVKNSDDTIHDAVRSLLVHQDYQGEYEVIVVGDMHDRSWDVLSEFRKDSRLRLIGTEIQSPRRDANAKRKIGLEAARGSVVALTDSDMILSDNWLTLGVELIDQYSVVAGPMVSIGRGFWGTYVDKNQLGNKTPRMNNDYTLNRENYGRGPNKPPVTANVFLRAEVLQAVGSPDPDFVYSYEDYSWFRDVVDGGFEIYCTSVIAGEHYHNHGWSALSKDYRRAGYGCADYVLKFPNDALSRKRLVHMFGFIGAVLLLIAGLVISPIVTILTGLAATVLISLLSGIKSGRLMGLVYPGVTLVLGSFFSIGMLSRLLMLKLRLIAPTSVLVLSSSEFVLDPLD